MSLDDERGFATLGARLDSVEHAGGLTGDRIYYLADPAGAIRADRASSWRDHALVARASQRREPFARIIVEKPIGRDLESAGRSTTRSRSVRRATDLPHRSLPW
jgi:glucose-6-phosphate 1-dehydrogenase